MFRGAFWRDGSNRRAQERERAAARAAAEAKRAEAERKAIVEAHQISYAERSETGTLLGEKGLLRRRVDTGKHRVAVRESTESADCVAVAMRIVDRLGA
jgi:UTP:GlnB (protein PII) uridylyltransferase